MSNYLYSFNGIVFISPEQFPISDKTKVSTSQINQIKRDNFLYKESMHKYLLGEKDSIDADLIITEKKEHQLEIKYYIEG